MPGSPRALILAFFKGRPHVHLNEAERVRTQKEKNQNRLASFD